MQSGQAECGVVESASVVAVAQVHARTTSAAHVMQIQTHQRRSHTHEACNDRIVVERTRSSSEPRAKIAVREPYYPAARDGRAPVSERGRTHQKRLQKMDKGPRLLEEGQTFLRVF